MASSMMIKLNENPIKNDLQAQIEANDHKMPKHQHKSVNQPFGMQSNQKYTTQVRDLFTKHTSKKHPYTN